MLFSGGFGWATDDLTLERAFSILRSRELEDQGDSDSGSLRTINLPWNAIEEMIGKEFDGRNFTVNNRFKLCD
ncbi:hypothetical protein ISN44_As07g005050 [Arabidopsis suecica]|uniref:Uncharacterized protein n=1 Tax=Arabidopsis suecica TaxID=45249 RepID=A0A8T2BP69_ARASU|nr:hypothetical protein ISN44_As07g005050 [Arabidopsis suecica]